MALREPEALSPSGPVVPAVGTLLYGLWTAVRLPVLTLLVILEPVVRVVLAGLALLLVLVAVLLELTAPVALHVPFWGMLATGIGCVWILAIYDWLLRVLSG